MENVEKIKTIILEAIPGAKVIVRNPRKDGMHFEAIVVAEQFQGLNLIEQHKLVMRALQKEFESSLHALGLKTYSPVEWQREQREEENG